MRNEANFIISMEYATELYESGVITARDYNLFEQKMIEKYRPKTGNLFSDLTLKMLDK